MADALGISSSHLTRLLKLHTGHGFSSHLRATRTERAKELLAGSDLTMKQVAASLGYTRATEFTRQFRAGTGVTPTTYRLATTRPIVG
jgi:AraC-like DNA-binding protein